MKLKNEEIMLCEYHAELFEVGSLPESELALLSDAIFNLASKIAKKEETMLAEKVLRRTMIHYILNKSWKLLAKEFVTGIKNVRETYGDKVAEEVHGIATRVLHDSITDFVFIALGLVESDEQDS